MKRSKLEFFLGITIISVATFFGIALLKLADKKIKTDSYEVFALFNDIDGIDKGSKVKIGGLDVGQVARLELDSNYKVKVSLKINKGVKIPDDSSLNVATSGIIGSKYLKIQLGGSDEYLSNGDGFSFTQSNVDLMEMVGKFVFSKTEK